METNAVAVWWYWWVRAREGMRHIDSAGGGRQIMVNFQATGRDGEEAQRIETKVRFVPMTTLASYNNHTGGGDGGRVGGLRDSDVSGGGDDETGGLYQSRYETWVRSLSEPSQRFVEREGRAARHCSALLYRYNRPLWDAIDQGLGETVADLLEAGMRNGRIEARVMDRIQRGIRSGREIRFVRTATGTPRQGTPPEPVSHPPSRCEDVILNNRKMYTPTSLRQIPLAAREAISLTKSGRRRHRARRYRAPRRLIVTVPVANDPEDDEHDDDEREEARDGEDNDEEMREEGEGNFTGGVDPLRIWPRASYIRNMTTYL